MDPIIYYKTVAHTVLEAKELAASIKLTLPTKGTDAGGLMSPVRGLILTGRDSPKNMKLLLGPSWRTVQDMISQTRIEVLLRPPPGSPCYSMSTVYDRDAPSWSPRPPTQVEQQKIEKARAMQAQISRRLGNRKEPNIQDMQAVMLALGREWDIMVPIYELAVNTMDQGVTYRAPNTYGNTNPNPSASATAAKSRQHDVEEETTSAIPDVRLFQPPSPTSTPRDLFPPAARSTRQWPRFIHQSNDSDILIFTDGACTNNGQSNPAAGWAFICRAAEVDKPSAVPGLAWRGLD